MTKSIIAALSVSLALACGLSTAHAADKTLAEIHGQTWPAQTGWAVKDKCMQCHGSYDKLAQATANLEPNPHFSHLGSVNCTECHQANKTAKETTLMCNSCHNFTLKPKAAKK